MNEARYRMILGLLLLMSLYYGWSWAIYLMIILLIFEAVTNKFVPERILQRHSGEIVSRMTGKSNPAYKYNFEADRITRFSVAMILLLGYVLWPESLWFLPWFVAFNVFLAGVLDFCPTTLVYQKIGWR